jgi:hypothetical protein
MNSATALMTSHTTEGARLCKLSGKPNASILPAAGGGLRLSLRAPLTTAEGVLHQLLHRDQAAVAVTGGGQQHTTTANAGSTTTTAIATGASTTTAIATGASTSTNATNADDATDVAPDAGNSTPDTGNSTPSTGNGAPSTGNGAAVPVIGDQPEGTVAPTAALVWLHGLGDSGKRWERRFPLNGGGDGQVVAQHHPDAPVQMVTAHNAEHTAWFDARCSFSVPWILLSGPG